MKNTPYLFYFHVTPSLLTASIQTKLLRKIDHF